MRIAYVVNSLGIGGTERLVTALAERMAARGHVVALVVLRARSVPQFPTRQPVHHLAMRKNPLSLLRGYADALRFLRSFQPDIVHSHNFHGNILARLLSPFLPAAKVMSTIHNIYEGGRLRMLAYRATDSLSHLSVAVSLAAADRFVRLLAVPAEKCRVITNGIDVEQFAPCAVRREQMRVAMKVSDSFVWIAAGRLAPAKDYPTLLQAMAHLRMSTPSAQLWIAGEGDARTTEMLRGLVAQLGLNPTVRWLGLRDDLPALLDAADGFVLSSAWEGMPLALGEAMAMEKPVVATDVGGVREMVGDAGKIVPAGDAVLLSEVMLAVMQGPIEARHALGSAARTCIVQNFCIDAKAEEWETVYGALLIGGSRFSSEIVDLTALDK